MLFFEADPFGLEKARQHPRISPNATLVTQSDRQRCEGDIGFCRNDGQQPRPFKVWFSKDDGHPCPHSTDPRYVLHVKPI
ncbi:hypothetical protein [Novacetimonas pomaceti]|uniref:hypothetical protein n=1 Tax=Novacetimonas pomaceti TaxID=2021998 RepID=UPI001058307B